MRKALMIFAALSLTACAGKRPIVTIPPAECAKLIPADHRQPVEAAPVPEPAKVPYGTPLTPEIEAMIVAPWAAAYVTLSGQLEKANGRTSDVVTIVEGCELRVNAARPDARH